MSHFGLKSDHNSGFTLHGWKPSSLFIKGGVLSYFTKKGKVRSIKREGLIKLGSYFHNNEPIPMLSFSVCEVCVLLIYTISIIILCVPWEKLCFIESNKQILTSASE